MSPLTASLEPFRSNGAKGPEVADSLVDPCRPQLYTAQHDPLNPAVAGRLRLRNGKCEQAAREGCGEDSRPLPCDRAASTLGRR